MNILNENLQKNTQLYVGILVICLFFVYFNLSKEGVNITNVSAIEAKTLVDNGAIVFDVREVAQYDSRHIPGAILLPLSILKIGIPIIYSNIKTKDIVIYCGDGITKGPVATSILNEAGYTKAVNIKPGIQGWVDEGFPIEKNS